MPRRNRRIAYEPEEFTLEMLAGESKSECEGCPFASHGFIFSSSDGSCMRNDYKKPKLRGSECAQIERARSIDLLSYLQEREPLSIRKSGNNEYCLTEHDSLKISNGRWYWFSRGFGGYSALDYLIKVNGMEFTEAVKSLTDGIPGIIYPRRVPAAEKKPAETAFCAASRQRQQRPRYRVSARTEYRQ